MNPNKKEINIAYGEALRTIHDINSNASKKLEDTELNKRYGNEVAGLLRHIYHKSLNATEADSFILILTQAEVFDILIKHQMLNPEPGEVLRRWLRAIYRI